MKRSQMVQILRDLVQESNGDFGDYQLEQADFVLKKLEKTGMLPPFDNSYKEFFAKEMGYRNWDHASTQGGFNDESINGWEPE